MGYGIVDIWIRWGRDCRPAYNIEWQVSIKQCSGAFPRGYVASGANADDPPQGLGEWSRQRCLNITTLKDAHIMAKVPPGCYIVDAYARDLSVKAHETMVVVPCGGTACVNLLAGRRGSDVATVAVQGGIALVNQQLDMDPARLRDMADTARQIIERAPRRVERVQMPRDEYNCLYKTAGETQGIIAEYELEPLFIG